MTETVYRIQCTCQPTLTHTTAYSIIVMSGDKNLVYAGGVPGVRCTSCGIMSETGNPCHGCCNGGPFHAVPYHHPTTTSGSLFAPGSLLGTSGATPATGLFAPKSESPTIKETVDELMRKCARLEAEIHVLKEQVRDLLPLKQEVKVLKLTLDDLMKNQAVLKATLDSL